MDKLKKTLSGDDGDEEDGIMTQFRDSTTLGWGTRIKGFIVCFVLGIVFSVLGTCLLWLSSHGLTLFAVFYTVGNLLSLSSTCFLMGPVKQCKKMFASTRIIATILVFVTMALALCAAFWWKLPALCLLFVILEFLAMTWYALSYIPFARDAVKKCFSSCIN